MHACVQYTAALQICFFLREGAKFCQKTDWHFGAVFFIKGKNDGLPCIPDSSRDQSYTRKLLNVCWIV